jgi:hypothetical protein
VAARLRRELDILDAEVDAALEELDRLQLRRSLLRAELARLRGACTVYAAELKVRAERRLGELLKVNPPNRGNPNMFRDGTFNGLPDGVNKKQSHRWQKMASIPEPVFEQKAAEAKERQKARKRNQPGASLATLPDMGKGDTRDQPGKTFNGNPASKPG